MPAHAPKNLADTDPGLAQEITDVMEQANVLSEEQQYDRSIPLDLKAWDMLPVPKETWDLASWITDSLFQDYFGMKNFTTAKQWAERGLACRASDISTSEFINLGMACFELGLTDEAHDYFHRAYEYGKKRAFQERPQKYLVFYLNTHPLKKP